MFFFGPRNTQTDSNLLVDNHSKGVLDCRSLPFDPFLICRLDPEVRVRARLTADGQFDERKMGIGRNGVLEYI